MTTARRYALAVGALVVLLAGAFGAGRYSRPAKVVTHETVRTEVQYRDRVQVQTVHDVQVQHDTQVQTRTVTVTRWAKAPDGTPVVTQETHLEQQQASHEAKAGETKRAITSDMISTTRSEQSHTVTTENRRSPAWSISTLVGAQLGGRQLLPGLPAPLVVGAIVERRILGPVSVGAWATSGAAGGVSLRLEF